MEFIDVSSTTSHREPPEPESLLEECWFFGNLLIDSKSKMSKTYSDLGPSSNYNTQEEMSVTTSEGSSSATPLKHPKGDNFDLQKLARAPSMPSYVQPKVDMFDQVKEKRDSGGSNSRPQNSLIREQSLPPFLTRQEEEDEDEESDFTLGRLIRQASLKKSSHILPPRHNSKAQSSSFPTKLKSKNMDMGDRYISDRMKIRRSTSDIQTKKVESFKTMTCVQENCRDKTKKNMMKNYSPTIPNWCDNEKRSSQDMKAEIKFWARAVASNVAAPSLSIVNRN